VSSRSANRLPASLSDPKLPLRHGTVAHHSTNAAWTGAGTVAHSTGGRGTGRLDHAAVATLRCSWGKPAAAAPEGESERLRQRYYNSIKPRHDLLS
jgi:hypothetical protein